MGFSTSSTLLAVLATVRLVTLPASLAAADHWILTQIPSIVFARMDPIIAPGKVSGHVHNILGASSFNQNINSPAAQSAAKCSSAIIGADKSNYWSPLLYYQYPNGTFSPVMGQNRIYYYTKTDDVQPFPPGLRMITGTAMTRDQNAHESLGVMISCNHGLQSHFLPNKTSNPGGCSVITMGIFFPSCGLASKDLDSPDHFSHMAWAQSYNHTTLVDDPNGMFCPESHPIKYPTIFFEANYYLNDQQPWRNDDDVLVLAHGDAVGTAYHADFLNGWDETVLSNAIKQCGNGKGPGQNIGACAPLAASMSESNAYACRLQGQIPAEDVGLFRPIPALPGCNPVWSANMGDTKPACTAGEDPAFVGPNAYFENLLYRMHIPLALPEAKSTDVLPGLIPGLGYPGASRIKQWGESGGIDDSSVTVGTYQQVVNALVGGDPAPVVSAKPSVVSNAGVALAQLPTATAAHVAASSSATVMCKRRMDDETEREIEEALDRREAEILRRERAVEVRERVLEERAQAHLIRRARTMARH